MGGQHDGRGAKDVTERGALIINYDLAKCRDILSDLFVRISEYATSDTFYEEYELALYEYFEWRDVSMEEGEPPEEFFRDEEEFEQFMVWYSLYFITDGQNKTFPDLYRRRHRYQLSPFEDEILKSYAESCLTLYEVQQVDPGKGFELKDLFSGRTCRVQDSAYARVLCTWDVVYAGLVFGRGMTFIGGFEAVLIPPRLKGYLLKRIHEMFAAEQEDYFTLDEFLRIHSAEVGALIEKVLEEYSGEPRRNSDGDYVCLATLHYRIADLDAFHKTIEESPLFSGGVSPGMRDRMSSQKETFTWIRLAKEGLKVYDTPPLGILTVDRNNLRAECNSRERSKRLRGLLENTFGPLLQYKTTLYEEPAGQSSFGEGCRGCQGVMAAGYERWLDQEVSDLDGLTPREAAMTAEGRERLIDLLKQWENENERSLRTGLACEKHPLFPVEAIRKELGL